MKYSIIFSTANRCDLLEQTLDSISRLDLDGLQLQVIVVDNGSVDETPSVLSRWLDKLPLVTFKEDRPGKNICLNQAILKATGQYLIFTDDDIIADSQLLQQLNNATASWPDDVLFAGRIDPRFPPSTEDWIRELSPKYSVLYSEYNPNNSQQGPINKVPLGPNMMVRSDVFNDYKYDESIGPAGKNYAMGSETEFLVRVKDALNCRYIYVPEAKVEHIVRSEQTDLTWILGRFFRAGRGAARGISTKRLRIGGVPWPVYLRFAEAWIKSKFGMLSSNKIENRLLLEKWRGCLFEFRQRQS